MNTSQNAVCSWKPIEGTQLCEGVSVNETSEPENTAKKKQYLALPWLENMCSGNSIPYQSQIFENHNLLKVYKLKKETCYGDIALTHKKKIKGGGGTNFHVLLWNVNLLQWLNPFKSLCMPLYRCNMGKCVLFFLRILLNEGGSGVGWGGCHGRMWGINERV